ncbi:hypothetical protein T06_6717 [Trichinella sp. T6]|nr:hypothetical protein T06_6717 [Trichinella sp. T6]
MCPSTGNYMHLTPALQSTPEYTSSGLNGEVRQVSVPSGPVSTVLNPQPFPHTEASSMRTTAHHSRIASASVLRQASSALSAGNCSPLLEPCQCLDIRWGDFVVGSDSHNHCKISLSVLPRRQIGDHGSGWPHAALFTQNPAQLTLHGHRAALPGGCTS